MEQPRKAPAKKETRHLELKLATTIAAGATLVISAAHYLYRYLAGGDNRLHAMRDTLPVCVPVFIIFFFGFFLVAKLVEDLS